MSKSKQRLRPWMEDQLNSGQFPGVEWIDRENKIFKLPWKHYGRQDRKESDGLIFMAWPENCGRFRNGIDEPDWSAWKSGLKNALRKLKDCEELTTEDTLHADEPYRVFKFLPKTDMTNVQNGDRPMESSMQCDDINGQMTALNLAPNIPTVVLENCSSEEQNVTTCVKTNGLPITQSEDSTWPQPVGSNSVVMETDQNVMTCVETNGQGDHLTWPQPVVSNGVAMETETNEWSGISSNNVTPCCTPQSAPDNGVTMATDNAFTMCIKYRGLEVKEVLVGPEGCHLYSGPDQFLRESDQYVGMPDPIRMLPILFPEVNLVSDKQKKLTQQNLECVNRGILLYCKNNSIYAVRKCKSRIFVGNANNPDSQTIKLDRDKATKIFDYIDFLECLQKYVEQKSRVHPSAEVLIGIGQPWKPAENPSQNLLIAVNIIQSTALHNLEEFQLVDSNRHFLPYSIELLKSLSDSLDNIIDAIKLLHAAANQNENSNNPGMVFSISSHMS